ncbi:hypothetical protein C4D60_Mb07t01470 [Musa balbisiana]|uniref:Uncharacterized protein n=1 Tax=Musa balbisiana TaxID=52838 RepID=A0A4S8JC66_MUSBA|nr:hypothetical protein C4D60_Mb07t01470 [Musa balbisiana]
MLSLLLWFNSLPLRTTFGRSSSWSYGGAEAATALEASAGVKIAEGRLILFLKMRWSRGCIGDHRQVLLLLFLFLLLVWSVARQCLWMLPLGTVDANRGVPNKMPEAGGVVTFYPCLLQPAEEEEEGRERVPISHTEEKLTCRMRIGRLGGPMDGPQNKGRQRHRQGAQISHVHTSPPLGIDRYPKHMRPTIDFRGVPAAE